LTTSDRIGLETASESTRLFQQMADNSS